MTSTLRCSFIEAPPQSTERAPTQDAIDLVWKDNNNLNCRLRFLSSIQWQTVHAEEILIPPLSVPSTDKKNEEDKSTRTATDPAKRASQV